MKRNYNFIPTLNQNRTALNIYGVRCEVQRLRLRLQKIANQIIFDKYFEEEVVNWPLSDTSICRCWYNAWLVGHNLTESIITLEIMTQLCWDIWPEVTRSSQYPLITSSPTLSPPAQWSLSSHQTQGNVKHHHDISLTRREFWNTSVNFCGEREGLILWEIQIISETGISWLSEIVSCQDVTWILNITSHQPS